MDSPEPIPTLFSRSIFHSWTPHTR